MWVVSYLSCPRVVKKRSIRFRRARLRCTHRTNTITNEQNETKISHNRGGATVMLPKKSPLTCLKNKRWWWWWWCYLNNLLNLAEKERRGLLYMYVVAAKASRVTPLIHRIAVGPLESDHFSFIPNPPCTRSSAEPPPILTVCSTTTIRHPVRHHHRLRFPPPPDSK